MNTQQIAGLLCIVSLCSQAFAESPPLIKGAIHAGHLYVAGTESRQYANDKLVRREIAPDGRGAVVVLRSRLKTFHPTFHFIPCCVQWEGANSTPLRWQISSGRFWITEFWPVYSGIGSRHGRPMAIPVGDVRHYPSPFEYPLSEKKRDLVGVLNRNQRYGWRFDPFDESLLRATSRREPVHFDFLAGADADPAQFVLAKKNLAIGSLQWK